MPPASRPVSRSAGPARRDLDARPGGARAGRSPRLTRQRERVAAGKDAERVARRRHTGDRAAVLAECAEVLDADRQDRRAGVELADQREACGRPAERLLKQPQAGARRRARQGGRTGDRENDGGGSPELGEVSRTFRSPGPETVISFPPQLSPTASTPASNAMLNRRFIAGLLSSAAPAGQPRSAARRSP